VASGYSLEMLTDEMARVIREVKPMLAVVITPMPRYLDPCCDEHVGDKTEEKKAEEQERLLKAVWGLKRETFQLLAKAHCKNTIVVGPMEVPNVKDSVDGVRGVMDDGVHLNSGAMGVLMDQVITKTEENLGGQEEGADREGRPGCEEDQSGQRRRERDAGEGEVRVGRGGGGRYKADFLGLVGKRGRLFLV
jgi:hypothetical protein